MSDHGFHPDHLRPNSIPDMPAGPAIEHSPYGIFVMAGPGIKQDTSVFGVSVLDLAPTVLGLYGLPVGEDMDGRVVTGAFENPPELATIPSWELAAPLEGCTDGRHPPHTRLDPVASAEAMEQLVALGYVDKPGQNIQEYVESTVRELKYNLVEAYQDGNRHPEALDIARDLCRRDPEEQRYALKRFLSCQALGLTGEMREIVDDMDGRRRTSFVESVERMKDFREIVFKRYEERKASEGGSPAPEEWAREVAYELNPKTEPPAGRKFLLEPEERKQLMETLRMRRYVPAMTDLLLAQTLTAEKRWFEALDMLRKASSAATVRPGILLQSAELLRRLGRLEESERAYRGALASDPDNVQAWLGLSRLALRCRDFRAAEAAADECVGRLFFYPVAHFHRAVARAGQGRLEDALESARTALSQNPHFPQAHFWLSRLLKYQMNDPEGAAEHMAWYRQMRRKRSVPADTELAWLPTASLPPNAQSGNAPAEVDLPPLGDEILVVSGLPRSGTSMLMQMLAEGGTPILTDKVREADEDNPRGYYEFEAAKKLFRDQSWIGDARGKAVKVVAPLVCSLPAGYRYRIVLIERDYEEILASQAKMIARRGEPVEDTPQRRNRLQQEFGRVMTQTRTLLGGRSDVRVLHVNYESVLGDPVETARRINAFAGGMLDSARMASAVDGSLHRNLRRGGVKEAPLALCA